MLIEPLDGADELSELATMLMHSCSVVRATVSTDIYGQQQVDWTTPAATTAGIPCRLLPKVRRELDTGAVIYDYVLHAYVKDVATTLLALGAEATHRIANVRYRWADASHAVDDLVDSGPFDIQEIANVALANHHVRLALKRVG